MGTKRRSFSKEFKLEAVRLVIEVGDSIARVSRDLGIRSALLGRWKQEYEEDQVLCKGLLVRGIEGVREPTLKERERPDFPITSLHQLDAPCVGRACRLRNRAGHFLQTLQSLPRK